MDKYNIIQGMIYMLLNSTPLSHDFIKNKIYSCSFWYTLKFQIWYTLKFQIFHLLWTLLKGDNDHFGRL